jgi:hypothetical protein
MGRDEQRRWPITLAIGEGLANARVGGTLSAVIIIVSAWVSATVGLLNASEVSGLVADEQEWISAGGLTFVVEPSGIDDTSVALNADVCDRLAGVDGVIGSFAVADTGTVLEPRSAPGSGATLFAVSAGALGFFDVEPSDRATVLAPAATAQRPGLADAEQTAFTLRSFADDDASSSVDATVRVVDSTVLADDLQNTYLIPSALTEGSTACYVSADAAHASALEAYLPAVLASETSLAIARTRLPEATFGTDFSTAYQERVTRWGWTVGAAVVALFWATIQRSRRGRLAVYTTFGAGPRARLVLQTTEWGVLSLIGSATGWVLAMTCAIAVDIPVGIALTQVTVQVASLWLAASIAVLALGLVRIGTVLDHLKDRT